MESEEERGREKERMSVEGKKGVTDWRSLSSFCDMQSSALQPALGGGNIPEFPRQSPGKGPSEEQRVGLWALGSLALIPPEPPHSWPRPGSRS